MAKAKVKPADLGNLPALLRRHGSAKLGHGCYAEAWGSKKSDRVLKICCHADPWPEYVVWANSIGYGGTLAPKLHSIKVFKEDGAYSYVASVERLEAELGKSNIVLGNKMKKELSDKTTHIKYRVCGLEVCGVEDIKDPVWRKFMEQFVQRFPYDKYCYDFHDGNWMIRKNGELVLNDPLETWELDSIKNKQYPMRWRREDYEHELAVD